MDFYFRDRVGNKTFVSQLARVNAASHHYWPLCLSTQTMNQVIEDIDAAGECAVELGLLEQFIWNHCRVSVGGSVFFWIRHCLRAVVNESSSGDTIVDGYRFAATHLTIIKLQLLLSQSAFKRNLER